MKTTKNRYATNAAGVIKAPNKPSDQPMGQVVRAEFLRDIQRYATHR